MTYASQADMTGRFGEQEITQLTDDGNGSIDTEKLAEALADAQQEIDAYIGSRYTVPLETPPGLITRLACDITRYFLYDDRVPEEVDKRYQGAIRFLKSVAVGQAAIPGISNVSSTGSGPFSVKTDADRVFTMDSLRDL